MIFIHRRLTDLSLMLWNVHAYANIIAALYSSKLSNTTHNMQNHILYIAQVEIC